MNPNYCHTVTLYNRLKATDNLNMQDIWNRTVLQNCFYKAATVQVQNNTSVSMSNAYTVRIPEDARYLPYRDWKRLPDKERKSYFTVSEGDILICGECDEEITGKSGNAAVQVMQRHKPDAFMVTSFSDNTSHPFGKHYRLGG